MTHSTDGKHRAFQANMLSPNAIRTMHAAVCAEFGTVDILFANHGVTGQMIGRDGNIEDLNPDEFERTWRLNTASSFLVCVRRARGEVWCSRRARAARTALRAAHGAPEMGPCRLLLEVRCAAHPYARLEH
jgi:NAD(P)-dependent dehydrogenase (short-subunit alcohol dehydrogenase family)